MSETTGTTETTGAATAPVDRVSTRVVEVDGVALAVHEAGDPGGPAVLWLHGSGPGASGLSNWQHVLPALPGFRHIAPDIPGFGDSAYTDPMPRGIPESATVRIRLLIGLLDALGVERAHVVGNSMGGMIALAMLLDHPARFERVVLMASGGAPVRPTEDLIAMITFYERGGTDDVMVDLIERFVHDTASLGGTVRAIAVDRVAAASRPQVRAAHEATFDPTHRPRVFSDEELAGITHEVLAIHGREDRMIPLQASLHLATHLPNAQLHVLPHTGHWVQIERQARFVAQVRAFLTEAG